MSADNLGGGWTLKTGRADARFALPEMPVHFFPETPVMEAYASGLPSGERFTLRC